MGKPDFLLHLVKRHHTDYRTTAPSYFSQFFEEQLRQCSSSGNHSTHDASSVRTLYIDRDPSTFCDISLHLQGYHIEPRDATHFVKLFADAQFFSRKCPEQAITSLLLLSEHCFAD